MNIIAIDCGASFIKAASLDEINASVKKELYFKTSEDFVLELVDPEDEALPEKLRKTLSVVKKCILELSNPGEEIILGMSNEMHGFVLANDAMVPYSDYISWQNEFTTQNYDGEISWQDYLFQQLDMEDVERTGMPFKCGLPSCNLAYLMQSKQIVGEHFYFFTLGDFLLSRLSGDFIPCHETNAAATGLYDLLTGDWNWKLIEILQLQDVKFPDIVKTQYYQSVEWQGRKLVIFPAIGDQQAALLGSGLQNDTQLSVNMGTGGQVSRISKQCRLSDCYQTRPYFNGLYLNTVPHIPSGRALNVFYGYIKQIVTTFAPNVCEEELWDWILKEASKSECAENELMQVDMSFFSNAVTTHTLGSIQGIAESSFDVGNLFCAIYKQMAVNVIRCAGRIVEKESVIKEILFSGGVSNRHSLFQKFVMEHFDHVMKTCVQNETFLGIYRYIKM